ncbi:MAG: tripartite tricarboxylate transporter substrate binding protein [Betaproteobacteria bacterium]|nr:tripartite tricarboxylate transporter substrate binding protein [Betaproteobacteria bacterium]
MSTIRSLGAFVGLIVFACGAAWSQPYPSKPVRVVVVFPAGGGTDTVARLVFQKVGEQLNQQFPIDNRAGAAGMIGGAIVAKSPPDGYTIMVYSQTLLVNAHVYRKMPYDVVKDFTGISMLTRLVGMLGVHPSLPVRTTKDLIALAKARPGELLYGTAGVGAYQHLSTSVFANMAGLKMTHVPFKGGAPAVVALMGGEIHLMITPIAELFPHINSGRVRAIAVTSDKRNAQFPAIPTVAETVKGYEFTSWFGCFAPAGTPKAIVDRLSAEIKQAVADPEVAAKLTAQGLDPMHMTPEAFAKHVRLEYDRLREVVKLSGARIE